MNVNDIEIDQCAHAALIAIPRDELSERLPGILAAVTACMTAAMGASQTAEILRDWADKIEAGRIIGHA